MSSANEHPIKKYSYTLNANILGTTLYRCSSVDYCNVDAGAHFVFSDNKPSGFSVFVDDIVPDASFASVPIRKLLDLVPGPHGSFRHFFDGCTLFDLYFENKESISTQCCASFSLYPCTRSLIHEI